MDTGPVLPPAAATTVSTPRTCAYCHTVSLGQVDHGGTRERAGLTTVVGRAGERGRARQRGGAMENQRETGVGRRRRSVMDSWRSTTHPW
jgi:hypothetical protein